jgi:quercetin dioxygenase-like cupin family protein
VSAADIVDLTDLGIELLAAAAAGNGRAARTLTPGAGAALRQTVMALTAGSELAEHTAPGPASVIVLEGEATVNSDAGEAALSHGQWTTIPREPHTLRASADAVILLTVAADA